MTRYIIYMWDNEITKVFDSETKKYIYMDTISDPNYLQFVNENMDIPQDSLVDTEYGLNQIRSRRDALLAACDWTQLPDSPKYNDEQWLIYRQALRDITEQTDLFNIVWPVKPED